VSSENKNLAAEASTKTGFIFMVVCVGLWVIGARLFLLCYV